MLNPVSHAVHHQHSDRPSKKCYCEKLLLTHIELELGSRTLYVSIRLPSQCFVCKQDINSHVIVLVQNQIVCVCVAVSLPLCMNVS